MGLWAWLWSSISRARRLSSLFREDSLTILDASSAVTPTLKLASGLMISVMRLLVSYLVKLVIASEFLDKVEEA